MGTRAAVILLVVAAALPLTGCSRRNRIAPLVPSTDPAERPTAMVVNPSPTRAAPPAPTETLPIAPDASGAPTPAIGASLDPLWDELESALGELDSALSGVEDWDVTVP